jgi:hypothetical protein
VIRKVSSMLSSANSLYHHNSRSYVECFSQAFDSTVERIVRRAKVNEQNLILRMMNNRSQIGPELRQLSWIELAKKDRELCAIPAAFKMIEYLATAFIVGNVVADDVVAPSSHRVVMLV